MVFMDALNVIGVKVGVGVVLIMSFARSYKQSVTFKSQCHSDVKHLQLKLFFRLIRLI